MTLGYILVVSCGLCALVFGAHAARRGMAADAGTPRMLEISGAILEGAKAYLSRQSVTIAIVGAVILAVLWPVFGWQVAVGFALGAVLSALAGHVGTEISVRANGRAAAAAGRSLAAVLDVALKAGTVTGMLVVGLGLLGVGGYYWVLLLIAETGSSAGLRTVLEALVALGFGASVVSIFGRLAGGIFTKGADVGADLVGRVEAGIPEDDPRNPAVIADNVGDNVGDCTGMAADLFESYVVVAVAAMLLGGLFFAGPNGGASADTLRAMLYPLLVCAACIPASIAGMFFMVPGRSGRILPALAKGLAFTALFSAGAILLVSLALFPVPLRTAAAPIGWGSLFVCAIAGIGMAGQLVLATTYYTSARFRPVRSVSRASETGHGTNVIQGLAVSMEATVLPVVGLGAGIIVAYHAAGIYGIGIAATAMTALTGMVAAIHAVGPVTDTAGGMVEMAGLSEPARSVINVLDAVGGTIKAATKGYAVGTAGLAGLVLLAAYMEGVSRAFPHLGAAFDLGNPYVTVGILAGGLLPYIFGAAAMTAVGRAAGVVVVEVRRQFREIPGIMVGTARPDYRRAVDVLARAAIRRTVLPSLMPVAAPLVLFGAVLALAGTAQAFSAVGGMLLGATVAGLFVAIAMTSGGSAWDNAKRYIEAGHHGGPGSPAHMAAITGDTVGDPYKDTAGPAIGPMIKILGIVASLLTATVIRFGV
ncbi:MAG TPA: sodium-translocating pyrophosphatase [Azospirillaceae bacterium]|nr:sodium-translocating pyrophosphatase [Azospirillaceae bacterium]